MPIEPEGTRWVLPDLSDPRADAEADDDLVGCGADLEPGTLLAAYRAGLFPMPDPGGTRVPTWWSPRRRGVLPLGSLRVSRSLRRSVRRMELRVDTAFLRVLAGCADPRRRGGWITADIAGPFKGGPGAWGW